MVTFQRERSSSVEETGGITAGSWWRGQREEVVVGAGDWIGPWGGD